MKKNVIEELKNHKSGYINIRKIDSQGAEIVDLRTEQERIKNPLKISFNELKKLNAVKLIY